MLKIKKSVTKFRITKLLSDQDYSKMRNVNFSKTIVNSAIPNNYI